MTHQDPLWLATATLVTLSLVVACSSPSEGPVGGPFTGSVGAEPAGGSGSGSSGGVVNAGSSSGSSSGGGTVNGSSSGSSSGTVSGGASSGAVGGSSSGSSSGAVGGSSSGSSSGTVGGSSSGTVGGSSSGVATAITWTELHTKYLASGTTGNCGRSGCHSECSGASGCYTWLNGKGYISGGINNNQLFTWTSGGFMPPNGTSSDAQAVTDFDAWTTAGSLNN